MREQRMPLPMPSLAGAHATEAAHPLTPAVESAPILKPIMKSERTQPCARIVDRQDGQTESGYAHGLKVRHAVLFKGGS
jgi:hypothetical protein